MLIYLLIATASSCTFENAFQKGGEDATQSSYGANLDRFCFGEDDAKRADFVRGYEAGRESAATLQQASIKELPSDLDDLARLLEKADRVMRMQQLRQDIADRELRIQQLQQNLQTNNELLQKQNEKIEALKQELQKSTSSTTKTQK